MRKSTLFIALIGLFCFASSCSDDGQANEDNAQVDVGVDDVGTLDEDTQTNNSDTAGGLQGRYVLIEDLSDGGPHLDAPGGDFDAVCVEKQMEGRTFDFCAQKIEDYRITGDESRNAHLNPDEILGHQDAGGEAQNFVSLGGMGGYVVVSFGEDVVIEPGDAIRVYELGTPPYSSQPQWTSEPYGVSYSDTLAPVGDPAWIFLGRSSEENYRFTVN